MYLFCKHITAVVTQVGCHTKTIPIGTSYQDLSFTLNCFVLKIIALKKMLTPQNWCKYTNIPKFATYIMHGKRVFVTEG